ncbi:hypothetical protein [Pelagicoccus sp. SDUM812002]|uniref:hypothetical protein n=1 Tax=Pelagicoccus sp. SDUM812002 TaxID=3041266 RepID=UPI00280E79C1|nr:hypothetical protein [Pelagicoccus sp. SDUM812002]MDQ8188338.1 hypothetical protein [Pelagicoccus sp. SDUM812002]
MSASPVSFSLSGDALNCVRYVGSFRELVETPFEGMVNAICWKRELVGDFDEIVSVIGELDEITTLEEDDLQSLDLSEPGAVARDRLIEDLALLRGAGLEPSLDCIPGYPRSAVEGAVPVDVYDFHADSATEPMDTYLCSYTVACSEGARNADVQRYVDFPHVRAAVLAEYGGEDDAGFLEFLRERFYDLHYRMRAGASAYSFGFGNMWRIATLCPGSPVPPCIHRAPTTRPGDPARLLLIS